jgi:rhomboid protease GluP
MLGRKKEGSVVCPSCGLLVGVNDDECLNCGRRNPGLWGFGPLVAKLGRGDLGDSFVQLIVIACAILYIASIVADPGGIRMGGMLSFLSPSVRGLEFFGASGAIPVFLDGRWWTVLSASWLHGGLLHIFFNMMWVRMLGPAVVEFYGLSRMILIYTIAGAVGFTASSFAGFYLFFMPGFLRGAGFTIGASASIFGLLGALLYYGRRSGSSVVGEQARMWALFLFIFGFIMPGVDNWAHLGGFVGGYSLSRWLDPLHPERLNHTIGALVCLGMTALAIVASVFYGILS